MNGTILIVGYRAYEELEQCLASIALYEPSTPVVVVDHDADADRARHLQQRFPDVTYLARTTNPGFGAGVNDAARHAGPGPLLVLNPDCRLDGPLLQPLTDVLAAHPRAGIAGALVLEADGSVQASARRFPDLTTGLGGRTSWLSRVLPGNPLSRRNLTTGPAAGVVRTDWVSGACMVIRRETFDAVGGFDERFFLYWEDADLCRRALTAGWETLYAPVARVIHLTARASRHAPVRSLWAFHRSAFRYHWTHGGVMARVLSPLVAMVLAMRFLARLIRR
ncbi:MAG: glycosyltransferase family 2 protein [Acidobacteria bacterium]|nr:glycosyltransferase family 2 protein [Acidobacteriota bacterium]